jgi:O-succinylbenzoic acid--CoA ligase
MLGRVLDRMKLPVSSRVRCVLVGGAALSPSLGRLALDAGLPVSATYGMTEACSQICSTAPGSDEAARGLVGRGLNGSEIVVARADDQGWGEILVRGPAVTRGYLRNPEADRRALRDGWLHTGDVGRLDEQGCLAVAGRIDDLIVTGGENVAPLEVEQVLDEHPDVAESMVIGMADDEWGQRVVALVVGRDGRSLDVGELAAWCRNRIAAYKVPREFRLADTLPRGASGKLLRRGLR